MPEYHQGFKRDGRLLILLTLREGSAVMDHLWKSTTSEQRSANDDFGRAFRVLSRELRLLNKPVRHYPNEVA